MLKFLVYLVTIFCTSCITPGSENSVSDSDFSLKNLPDSGLIIGGIVSVYDEKFTMSHPNPGYSSSMAELAEKALLNANSKIQVTSAGQFMNQISTEKYQEILNSLQKNSKISGEILTYLGTKKLASPYLLLAKLNKTETERKLVEVESQEDNGNDMVYNFYSIRKLNVDIEIYDINFRKLVWKRNIDQKTAKKNPIYGIKNASNLASDESHYLEFPNVESTFYAAIKAAFSE